MRRYLILFLGLLLLAGCSSTPGTTSTPEITGTPEGPTVGDLMTQIALTPLATPTITPTPRFTPTSSEIVLFEDDFEDENSGWEIGDYQGGTVGYQEGLYRVTSVGNGTLMWGVASQNLTDTVVEVDTTQVTGPASDYNGYGVYCRFSGETGSYNAYMLLISGDGFFTIQKMVGNSITALINWTSSDAINLGNASNHLTAICDGNYLALYANGIFLGETTDDTLTEGDVALAAVSLVADDPTEVVFDNITIFAPR